MTELRACPDCCAGKHINCDGTTWDEVLDCPTTCPCSVTHPRSAADRG